jgi:succinoglycan biosynthesis transport protein ExoP
MRDGLVPQDANNSALSHNAPFGDYAVPVPESHPLDRPLAALRRYKFLILGVFILATAAGVAATRLIEPVYEVRATIWIASQTPQDDRRIGPIRSSELLNPSAWIELFRSYRTVDEVVAKLALFLKTDDAADYPLFTGFSLGERFAPGKYELTLDRGKRTWVLRGLQGVDIDRGSSVDSVGRKVGFKWKVPDAAFSGSGERVISFTVATPRETSLEVLDRLGSNMKPGSNFLWLTYQDPDPRRATLTLNTWVSGFVKVAADLKKRNMVEFAKILEEQLQYAERATQEAENAYQQFRVNTITLPTEFGPVAAGVEATRDPALQSYFEQKIAFDNLRHDREALEKNMATASRGSATYEGLLLIPSVAQSPGAQALRNAFQTVYETQAKLRVERQIFTDEYPSVKELVRSLDVLQSQTIPQLAGQLLAQLRERESDYQRRIEGASRELQKIPPRTIEEMRLNRAVVVAEGLYTNLKNRYAEAKLAEAGANPDVSVLDTAIAPLKPSKNTMPMVVLLAVVGGLGAGIGLALLLDRLDRRVRYPDQAMREMGLLIAGAVPKMPKRGIHSGTPEQVLQFVESFRSLRMHVMNSVPGKTVKVAVTSAAPGDGKSLVSANLAMSFAETGLRTVLIDGDTRRGALHKLFGLKLAGGLTDFLDGTLQESQIVRPTPHENLSFISGGRRNHRSPELLASPRLRLLVEHLSESFDVLIFDTPPLAAGIDGYAISAAAGRMLMVLRMGQTERRMVSAKLAVMDRLPVDALGAVLNGVELTGEFQYYAYTPGYSVEANDSNGVLTATGHK